MAGVGCLIGNLIAGRVQEWGDEDSVIVRTTPGNYGDPFLSDSEREAADFGSEKNVPIWQPILHLAAGVCLMAFYPWIKNKVKETAVEIDIFNTTPSDFTVWVKGLPPNYSEEELTEHFEKNSTFENCKVTKVVPTYDISEHTKLSSEILKLERTKNFLSEYPGDDPTYRVCCVKKHYMSLEDCQKKLEELKSQEKELSEDLEKYHLAPIAFVSFSTQIQARQVDEIWSKSPVQRFWDKVLMTCGKETWREFSGKYIEVSIAAEPSDVFWENLDSTYFKRLVHKTWTFVATCFLLLVSFVCLYYIGNWQEELYSNYKEDEDAGTLSAIRLASILPSFIVVLINFLIGRIIRLFASLEKHLTWTDYNESVANKLVTAMAINTGVVPLLVNYSVSERWFVPGGLAEDIFWILIADAFFRPFFQLLKAANVLRKIKIHFLEKKDPETIRMSQFEANKLYEGPEIDLANLYANIIKTSLVTLAYSPLLPLGLIVTFFGLSLDWVVSKYLIVNVYSRPRRHNESLAMEMAKWVEVMMFFHALGAFVFFVRLDGLDETVSFVHLIAAGLYFLTPLNYFFGFCIKDHTLEYLEGMIKDDPENDYYTQVKNFHTDYERENPVTQEKGWSNWFALFENPETDSPVTKFKSVMSNYIGTSKAIHNYTARNQIGINPFLGTTAVPSGLEIEQQRNNRMFELYNLNRRNATANANPLCERLVGVLSQQPREYHTYQPNYYPYQPRI